MTTPNEIKVLKDNQIFVFGSNLNGSHGGGAAEYAKQNFGAVEGVSEGITGKSYAFPTLDKKMRKVSKKAFIESKNLLYKTAEENKDKQFLVTRLGCGIADFEESMVKKIFTGVKPENVILPAGWATIRGFKAFSEGMICRGFQYELGKDYFHDGKIELCSSGFHFCKNMGDVYKYYSFGDMVCEVESDGEVIDEYGGNKSVTNHIRVIRVLGAKEAHGNKDGSEVGYFNTGDWNTGDCNTGDCNTGNRNTGDCNTGDCNTGNHNTGDHNTGDWNTGNRNTGDRNTGDWNTGNRNTGYFNIGTPKEILVFGKMCKLSKWEEADKPRLIYFETKKWIDFSEMTDEEKENNHSSKTTGGYLKKLDYKKAFQDSYNNASDEDKKKLKKLPNFNKKIFFEISGIIIN